MVFHSHRMMHLNAKPEFYQVYWIIKKQKREETRLQSGSTAKHR